ncbi:hypothetical protein ACKQTC_08550 [Peptococcus simiae]|uniref:HTH cro/C1-type domain-containing protein n=1 Tax=Peptococcus simiae TaxID=1643805 RepID=A0ABW9H3E9_9FIRM
MKSEFEKQVRIRLLETDGTLPGLAKALGISLGYIYELFANPGRRSPYFEKIANYLEFELPKGE